MAKGVIVRIDEKKYREAVNGSKGLPNVLESAAREAAERANAMSSGYRTALYHKDGQTVGNTQPHYVGDAKVGSKGPVGIVHPKNYAAMKDNYENNTMLKAVQSVQRH